MATKMFGSFVTLFLVKFFPLIQLVVINWFNSEIYFLTGESVKSQITDSISKNLTDSDLESRFSGSRII